MTSDVQYLDGNAAGGLLEQIFAVEMTSARITCAHCNNDYLVGGTVVYASPMGTIIRCPGCSEALIRIARGSQHYWVDCSGARLLQLPVV